MHGFQHFQTLKEFLAQQQFLKVTKTLSFEIYFTKEVNCIFKYVVNKLNIIVYNCFASLILRYRNLAKVDT